MSKSKSFLFFSNKLFAFLDYLNFNYLIFRNINFFIRFLECVLQIKFCLILQTNNDDIHVHRAIFFNIHFLISKMYDDLFKRHEFPYKTENDSSKGKLH